MDDFALIQQKLETAGNPEKATFLPQFFRAEPGGYGEGDQFLGVSVPDQRRIAKEFKEVTPATAREAGWPDPRDA